VLCVQIVKMRVAGQSA